MHSILRRLAAIFAATLVLFALPVRAADPPAFRPFTTNHHHLTRLNFAI